MLYEMDCTGSGIYRYAQKDNAFAGWKEVICPGCGRRVSLPVYSESNPVLVLEGGKKYPDFLQFCGAGSLPDGGRLIVLSEKALTVFREEGISGIGECKPVVVVQSAVCRYCVDDAPRYFAVDITGSVDLDYSAIGGLRLEARQKLDAIRPMNLGQASRVSGVSPADIAVLMVYLKQ